jgi:hypothetical protein
LRTWTHHPEDGGALGIAYQREMMLDTWKILNKLKGNWKKIDVYHFMGSVCL